MSASVFYPERHQLVVSYFVYSRNKGSVPVVPDLLYTETRGVCRTSEGLSDQSRKRNYDKEKRDKSTSLC